MRRNERMRSRLRKRSIIFVIAAACRIGKKVWPAVYQCVVIKLLLPAWAGLFWKVPKWQRSGTFSFCRLSALAVMRPYEINAASSLVFNAADRLQPPPKHQPSVVTLPLANPCGDRCIGFTGFNSFGFDIVIQAPSFMDQNNHWRVLCISLGKIGADRAAIWGCLIDGKPLAACASVSLTLASDKASVPARNNRRSVGDTDGRYTSFGSHFSRPHTLFTSIQKIAKRIRRSIRTGFLQKTPDDDLRPNFSLLNCAANAQIFKCWSFFAYYLGFVIKIDQTDGE